MCLSLHLHIRRSILLFCFLLSVSEMSHAQTFNFRGSQGSVVVSGDALSLAGFPVTPYSMTVWCNNWDFIISHYTSWGDSIILKSSHANVRFYVDDYDSVTTFMTPVDYSYQLAFHVIGYTSHDTSSSTVTNSDTLTISFNNGRIPYQDINLKKYSNFYKMTVVLDGIYINSGGTIVPAPLTDPALRNFKVEALIETQHFDKREYGDIGAATEPVVNVVPHPSENYLDVSWLFSSGPVSPASYQLEWTYVDDYGVNPSSGLESPRPISDLHYNFASNSTRVWVTDDNYRIPLVYSRGYVVYRVRAVRPDSVLFKYPVTGKWSLPGGDAGNVGSLPPAAYYYMSVPYSGDSLNWQYTASFAEGGRYKNVASFYDGLLKNRQSITRFNSNLTKLIATGNVYDYEGRLSIKTLPTPIKAPSFRYQFNLALNSVTNLPYKAADFDTGSIRYSVISPLASNALANIYYSNQNGDTILRHQKFIADAQGYPFIQTIFEAGNDRIAAVGGAGSALQIGDSNYVSNSYVGAIQPRLNSFFGPNVGWNNFYTMTVSKDPNQQYSMTIKDYHGKQMASALVGTGPSPTTHALEHITVPIPNYQTADLLANPTKEIDISNGTNIANSDYFSEANSHDTIQYSYSFTPYEPCAGQYLSVQGHYSVTITDPTGNIVNTQSASLGTTGTGTSGTPFTYTGPLDHFAADVGPYHVNKQLAYSPLEIKAVLDTFFNVTNCFLPQNYFVKKSVSDATFPCPGDWPGAASDTDDCTKKRWEMMQQLVPDAVYGKYTVEGAELTGTDNSIYTRIGCPMDTAHLWSTYPDTGLFHCYHALATIAGDSSHIVASQGIYGIVDYRCFCATVSIPDTCTLLSSIGNTVTITLTDVYDSTRSVYFPFLGGSGEMSGNFTLLAPNWSLGTANGDIYSGTIPIGHISQSTVAGHHTTTISLIVGITGSTIAAIYGATMGTPGGDSLYFTFIGNTTPTDTLMHYDHPYTYDSAYLDIWSPLCHKRYQDTCMLPEFPDSITVFGTLHTGLRTMNPLDFNVIYKDAITAGNYSLAEAMLPLHPQYCQLKNCFVDSFKRQLIAIPDWETAQSMGLLYLDDIIARDPIKAKMAAIGFVNPADSLSKFPGSQARIDSFVFLHGYCGCLDSIMFSECYNYMFNYEITHHLLINSHVKKFYFENIYNTYLANRARFVDSVLRYGEDCGPCALARMTLDPSFEIFPEPIVIDSPILLAPSFTGFGHLGGGSWSHDLLADSLENARDSSLTAYRDIDSTLFTATIDSIIARLGNCIAGDTAIESDIRAALVLTYISGMAPMGNFTQKQVYDALVGSGAIMSDFCNPMAFDFTEFGSQPLDNDCLPPAFYSSLGAFLGGPVVRPILTSPTTTPTSYTLDTLHSLAEMKIYRELGNIQNVTLLAGYDVTKQTYVLVIGPSGGGTTSVKIYLHSPDCSHYFDTLAGTPFFVSTSCIASRPLFAGGTGLVNQYSFIATIAPTAGGLCNMVGWMDRVKTTDKPDDGVPHCIPCTQMRAMYTRFEDSMQVHGIKGSDHPLYRSMLANFMNNQLLQQYTAFEYETFIESCALADSMLMPLYAGYATCKFNSLADMNGLISALNAIDPQYTFDNSYRDSVNISGSPDLTLRLDLNAVPASKMWRYRNEIASYSAPGLISTHVNQTLADIYPGIVGFIYVDPSFPFSPGDSGIVAPGSGISFSITPYQKFVWVGNEFAERSVYDVTQTGDTPSNISRAVYNITAYLYNHGTPGVVFTPAYKSTIDAAYFKPEKQAYLEQVYSFQALPDYEVLNKIQAEHLVASIPSYSLAPYNAAYSKETNSSLFKNLYLWNAGMNTRYFDTLQHIVNLTSSTGAIFFDPVSTAIPLSSSGDLMAYICSNKTYWYRYFTTGDTLFNVYLAFPERIPVSMRSSYRVAGPVIPMPGDSVNRYFGLKVTRPGTGDTLLLHGQSDFTISNAIALSNVLLRKSLKAANGSNPFENCETDMLKSAVNAGTLDYRRYMDSVRSHISANFTKYVINSASERLILKYTSNSEGITLYNYDRAGNLTFTVPPAGVDILPDAMLAAVDVSRTNNTPALSPAPAYNKKNSYTYTSYNQVNEQNTINAGTTRFMYDAAGRLMFSQNAKQADSGAYTYNIYDEQGRIRETGELTHGCHFGPYTTGSLSGITACAGVDSLSPGLWYVTPDPAWVRHADRIRYSDIVDSILSHNRRDVVNTVYDTAAMALAAIPGFDAQQNLRKRVSCVRYFTKLDTADTTFVNYDYAMHYSYDIQGNVQTLVHDNPALEEMKHRYIRVDYDFDVISGKVNMLSYNRGAQDQFYQAYDYDADNRITEVRTSSDGFIWKREARYAYYDHGPLARVEIGEMPVQGLDYAYTIQGWLKALNSDTLNTDMDMGEDGSLTSITAMDAVAHTLDYFNGDYSAITGRQLQHTTLPVRNLYNGNIARQTMAIDTFIKLNKQYIYDQLNRIIKADYAVVDPATGALTGIADFHSRYAYDWDGNIQTLLRYGNSTPALGGPAVMDSLTYNYPSVHDDKLADIYDSAANVYTNDVPYNVTATLGGRYTYDPSGNLTKDLMNGHTAIKWNLYNKVTGVTTPNYNSMKFEYDGAGNRLAKHFITDDQVIRTTKDEYYIRDAQGNVLATYTGKTIRSYGNNYWELGLASHDIYGSSRLGQKQYYGLELGGSVDSATYIVDTLRLCGRVPWYSLEYQDVIKPDSMNLYQNTFKDMYFAKHVTGKRQYEVTDHLGNVLATLSDKRLGRTFAGVGGPLTSGATASITSYKPIVTSSHDYYPFGQYMPGRYTADTNTHCITTSYTGFGPLVYYAALSASPTDFAAFGTGSVIVGSGTTGGGLIIGSTADVSGATLVVTPISTYGGHLYVDVMSVVNDHILSVRDNLTGVLLGNIPVFSSTPAGPVDIVLTPVPHSDNVLLKIECIDPAGGSVTLAGISIPHDSTVAYNLSSTACNADAYNYGYNGQLKVNEWAGVGNHLEFKERGYDPRIGRFICVDPITQQYPWYTPYQFAGNTPIWAKDLEGLEPAIPRNYILGALGAHSNDGPAAKQWANDVLIPTLKNVATEVAITGAMIILPELAGEILGPMLMEETFVVDATRVARPVYGPVEAAEVTGAARIKTPNAGTIDYSSVPNPKSAGPGNKFTPAQKKAYIEQNMKQNGGVIKSDQSGITLDIATQSKKGVKANMNQAEVDHVTPRSKGGKNTSDNVQILSKEENIKKSDK